MSIEPETTEVELCDQCGHPWDPHRICGYGDPPVEGWIECPVEGCKCHSTWSLEPEVAAQIRARKQQRDGGASGSEE